MVHSNGDVPCRVSWRSRRGDLAAGILFTCQHAGPCAAHAVCPPSPTVTMPGSTRRQPSRVLRGSPAARHGPCPSRAALKGLHAETLELKDLLPLKGLRAAPLPPSLSPASASTGATADFLKTLRQQQCSRGLVTGAKVGELGQRTRTCARGPRPESGHTPRSEPCPRSRSGPRGPGRGPDPGRSGGRGARGSRAADPRAEAHVHMRYKVGSKLEPATTDKPA